MRQMQLGVQEALTRAEQAELREINSQTQLTKALETMQQMQLGVQEALTRAEQAEIRQSNAQELLCQKNIELADVVHRLSVVNEANHNHWLLTQDLQRKIDEIFASKSWRITAPLRWPLAQFKLLKKYGFRVRLLALERRIYLKINAYLLSKPQLKNLLLRFSRFLGIYGSLRIFSHRFRNDFVGEVLQVEPSVPNSGDSGVMSDRAREIYIKLQNELRDGGVS